MDAQRKAVLELAERYQYEPNHAHQVECLAGTLFLLMRPLHNLETEERKLLEFAAILHDIGYFLSPKGHHRHALHLILNEPLQVFTRSEKAVIANIARYHRKALPTVEHTAFAVLSDEDKRRVMLLAPLLRVADALDRGHTSAVKEMRLDINDEALLLRIGVEHDIPEEIWAVERRCEMFEQVYGRKLHLITKVV